MRELINTTKKVLQINTHLPFSIYSSIDEQLILNVPIIKPLLVFVLSGSKKLDSENEIICPAGNFIFLSNIPIITMRNIPSDSEYYALLIEFEYADFDVLERKKAKTEKYFQGAISPLLKQTLMQFIEWSTFAPKEMWPIRRKELLQTLLHLGFDNVSSIIEPPSLSHKIHKIISTHISSVQLSNDLTTEKLSSMLAMSESTLRRKLNAEGTNLQTIKDRARLGYGLHLIQTTKAPVSVIAEQCGYTSQSRFTDKFKTLFNITPTELRKTILRD